MSRCVRDRPEGIWEFGAGFDILSLSMRLWVFRVFFLHYWL